MNRYVFSPFEVKAVNLAGFSRFLRINYKNLNFTPDDAESLQLGIDFEGQKAPIFCADAKVSKFAQKLHRSFPKLCFLLDTSDPFFRDMLACRYGVSEVIEKAATPYSAVIGFNPKQRALVEMAELRKLVRVCDELKCPQALKEHLSLKFIGYNADEVAEPRQKIDSLPLPPPLRQPRKRSGFGDL